MAQNEDSEFLIAKALRERIFKIPLLPQEKIVAKFAEIDAILYPLAIKLAEHIPLVRDYFKDIVHKLASGNTLGKNYFNKRDNEDEKGDKKKLLKKSEMRILSETFPLLRHSDTPKKFCKTLKDAGFMRGVMEEAIEIFIDAIGSYETLNAKLHDAAKIHSLDYLKYEKEIKELIESLGLVYHEHDFLDQLVPEIKKEWEHYLKLRQALISPYFRQVYTISVNFSNSDSQTLDNFQNGVLGLMRAYKCYTASRFAAFSLVAEQWIKQSILLHIKTEVNFIKLPIANWHSFQKLEKIKQKLEQQTVSGKQITPAQIAEEAKMATDKVKKIYENVKLAKVLSLNVQTSNEEENSEGPSWSLESIKDETNIHEMLENQAEFEIVRKVATHFDDEELIIFSLISGCMDLIDNSEITAVEIEKEKIRQLGVKYGFDITFNPYTGSV